MNGGWTNVDRYELAEEEEGEEDIEDDGEGSGHIVKRHLHPLQTQVVEGYHPHKYQGEGQHLTKYQLSRSNINYQDQFIIKYQKSNINLKFIINSFQLKL